MQRKVIAAYAVFGSLVFACGAQDTAPADDESVVVPSEQSLEEAYWRRRHRDAGTIDSGQTVVDAGGAVDSGSTPTADASAPIDAGTTTDSAPPPPPTSTGTTTPPPPPPPSGTSPRLAGCDMYPADNAWNRDVSHDAVHANSGTYIANMAPSGSLHADWGTSAEQYGMPINAGPAGTPVPITWTTSWGNSESDKLACPNGGGSFCYPIPTSSKIEGGPSADPGADRHLLFLDTTGAPSNCTLYELYMTQNYSGGGFTAGNGAIFHLGSNALRPDGWTSSDAAGLPVLPGLVRYDEVTAGAIKHALRFTMKSTQQAYIHPATHAAGSSNASLPPMGLRVRLKAGVSVTNASPAAQVLLTAMKTYGLLLADNGSNWYVTGDMNDGWSGIQSGIQSMFNQLHGSDFEAVESGPLSTNGL